ncbi:MAG: sulfotransferase domain-containing protein [Caulobacterales bacterium]|nr:sulfotransferase domain-containing protein [Caulobacterales bacterium]
MTPWPAKTRELVNRHMDSRVWNRFALRDGDVVVASYAKSGTTWVQQIVTQLIHHGAEDAPVATLSPWLDYRLTPPEVLERLAAQVHRRVVKTHLPLDALGISPRARYLYVARDGRDVAMSLHHHHGCGNALWYERLNAGPAELGPPMTPPLGDPAAYFRAWLGGDGAPFWPYFENIRTWWPAQGLPNVLFLHFNALKADLLGQVRRIAAFLDLALDEALLARVLDHASFGYMRAHAEDVAPLGGRIFEGGAQSFLHHGENGRWRAVLSEADAATYEARARAELGSECAQWLATGLPSPPATASPRA